MPMTDRPPLSAAQWDRIADAFDGALLLPAADRATFAESALHDDPHALAALLGALSEHERGRPLSIEEWLVNDTPRVTELTSGTRIGVYRVDALIGRGGMGEVYRGERVDGTYEQAVAIKVLREGFASQELMRRFKTERRILARLTHANIVGILDGGTTEDGRPFLVMPCVEGVPITTHCRDFGLSLDQRLQLFIDVMAAVQYAHGQLVIHRDIKPSNIIVTASGQVRLLDFGIAKMLSGGDPTTGAETRSELRLLTPEHASPEQLRGEAVGTASDVYALGVLLYELVTGTKPHRASGRTPAELERDILQQEPPLPSVAASGVTWGRRLRGDLDRITMVALRKEPERRYASVGQFADDIERFLKGLPVSAARDRLSYRVAKFVKRNRAVVSASVVVASLLLVFSVGTAWQARQIARERDRAQREQAASETVVRFLTAVIARGNPMVVPGGDTLRVQQLLAVGEELVDSLPGDPFVQGRILRVLGTMHLGRGKLDVAQSTLRRAYDLMMTAEGSDSLEVAQTYLELARAVERFEGLPKALPMFRESVARLRQAGAPAADVLVADRELAQRIDGLRERQRALEQLIAREGVSATDSMERAGNLNALGINKLGLGNIKDAVELFDETLRLLSALLPAGHPNRLTVAGNLAAARRDYGDYAIAESMAREVLALQRAQVTPNPLGVANAEGRLALIMAYRGFLEEAEQGLERALALERTNLAPTHSSISTTMFNRGVIAALRGRHRLGLARLDSSFALLRRSGGGDTDTLPIMDFQAMILLDLGRVAEASAMLRSFDRQMRRTFPIGNPYLAIHDEQLGTAALLERRPSEALRHFSNATEARRTRVSASNPELAGAECGTALALTAMGRVTEATPAVRDACTRYRQLGIHSRALVRIASGARDAGSDAR